MGFAGSVRPRLLLVARGGSPGLPSHQEAERRWNIGQDGGGQGATQLDQSLEIVRHDVGDGVEPGRRERAGAASGRHWAR